MAAAKQAKPQIRSIWGLTKELGIGEENMYAIMQRLTGKVSMRTLTNQELNLLVLELGRMKDGHDNREGMASKEQIWKIHELEKALGWADNPARLNGFMKKVYRVERTEWLKNWQAHKLIESLKALVEKGAKS